MALVLGCVPFFAFWMIISWNPGWERATLKFQVPLYLKVEHKCLNFSASPVESSSPFKPFAKVMKAAFLFVAALLLGAVSADEHNHVVITGMQPVHKYLLQRYLTF